MTLRLRVPVPLTDPRPTTIAGVLDQLDIVIRWAEQQSSTIGYFAAVYRGVTVHVQQGIAERRFDDGSRMERFDTTFATRYLTALDEWQHGRPASPSWAASFDAADDELIILQHLVLAVNAHMRLDLGVAAATIAPGDQLASLKSDFDEINRLLAELVPADKAAVERLSPALAEIDRFGHLTDLLVDAVIEDWRRESWRNAQRLAKLSGDAFARAEADLDHRVASEAHGVVHPDPLARALIREVRRFEPKDPAVVVRALDDRSGEEGKPARPGKNLGPRHEVHRAPAPEQPSVLVLGGGVGGLTAAHELVERGFSVTLVEQRDIVGGKARSYPVAATATGGREGLPGEHGFRFFAGFYRHVIDTMSRIPSGSGSVLDHLVDAEKFEIVRTDYPGVIWSTHPPRNLAELKTFLVDLFGSHWGLSDDEVLYLTERFVTLISSCDERWFGEWEYVAWWDFVGAAQRSIGYQKLVGALTQAFVAARPTSMSTRTGGRVALRLMEASMQVGGHEDRVLDGPTSEVWLDPWRAYLARRGVTFRSELEVRSLRTDGRRLTGVEVGPALQANAPAEVLEADWYVLSVPADRAAPLFDDAVVAADPGLADVARLQTGWMAGIQLYLAEDVTMVPGHVLYLDSLWALTSISQAQFWPRTHLAQLGDGRVRGVLSVDISNFDAVGLNGKTARECTRDEIVAEVIAQVAMHKDEAGLPLIDPANVLEAHLDDDIRWPDGHDEVNVEPMLLNTVGSWNLRPEAQTAIANLFLASDYVRTNTDLATMEGANEAARRAVNALLDVTHSTARRCRIWEFDHPAWAAPLRALDKIRWDLGHRHHGAA